MKPYPLLVILLICAAVVPTLGNEAPSINKIVAQLNTDAKTPAGEARAFQSVSKSTGVPSNVLQKQKAQTGLAVGDLYVAHAISAASGKSFSAVVAAKRGGQTWAQIAEAHNVSLGGGKSKVVKGTAERVRGQNERDRQQAVPNTSRVERESNRGTLSSPSDKWP